jgi:uncharacterized OsmC-like protein
MVKSTALYTGQKHCTLTHEPSGAKIETDAPKDNQGLGAAFSPTDLVGAALTSCMLTTMALVGERDGLQLEGMRAEVAKTMTTHPRRVDELTVVITLPKALSESDRKKMEHSALSCPVKHSLHPDVKTPVTFKYE